MKPATVIAAIAFLLSLTAPQLYAANDDPDGRILRVERWLIAALSHQGGQRDDAVTEASRWSDAQLRALFVDEGALTQLMQNPLRGNVKITAAGGRQPPAYSTWQLRRLRVLACAVSGELHRDACARLTAEDAIDPELKRLAKATGSGAAGSVVLRRGAILHGDVAMLSPNSIDPLDGNPGRFRVQMNDGQATSFGNGGFHWVMARGLLDAVTPAPDEMVRQWYFATSLWMQGNQQHETDHIRHAVQMFPADPGLLFLGGCQMETYAGASIQSVVRSAALPSGYSLDVPSEAAALRDAEDFFRRALARNAEHGEARLRLGHVLLARGRPQQAADELRMVDTAGQPPVLQYFHAMFLGSAEEALGHLEAARTSYEQAAELFDGTQSPRLALSALAMRRGDRAGALASIQPLFANADVRPGDPWWDYYIAQARDLATVFDEFYTRYVDR